jgi:hypothetical protein
MLRLARADCENADMSAEERSWWFPPIVREEGGRREDFEVASGVLFLFPIILLAMIVWKAVLQAVSVLAPWEGRIELLQLPADRVGSSRVY